MNPQNLLGEHASQLFNLDRDNLFRILVIVIVAWLLMIVVNRLARWLASRVPGGWRLYVLPLGTVLRLAVLIAAIIFIIPLVIQPTFQNLIAIVGSAALALGFAVKDYISSLIAGIVALYERPYRAGDWVTIDGAYGEVQSVGLRSLRLWTFDDTVVTIPHLKLWDTNIYNSNDGNRNLLCVADFYLDPQHDALLVRQKLHEVILTSPYLDLNSRHTVVLSEKPWGTHYRLKAYPVEGRDQRQFISDLTVRGKAALAEMGVKPARVPVMLEQKSPGIPDRS